MRREVPAGTYRLEGRQGWADVEIAHGPSPIHAGHTEVVSVKVAYHDYSGDGVNIVNGTEEGIKQTIPVITYTWHADLTLSGGTPARGRPANRAGSW